MTWRARVVAVVATLFFTAVATATSVVHAADAVQPEAFARVVVDSADLRTGPGVSYRVLYTAHRGETFALDGRPGTGFWLRVLLPDGRIAYALGDEVQPFAVDPNADNAPSRPGLFAPPPLTGSRGGVALVGGLLWVPEDPLSTMARSTNAPATPPMRKTNMTVAATMGEGRPRGLGVLTGAPPSSPTMHLHRLAAVAPAGRWALDSDSHGPSSSVVTELQRLRFCRASSARAGRAVVRSKGDPGRARS